MNTLRGLRTQPWSKYVLPVTVIIAVALFPLFRPPLDGFMDDCILALAYVVMALGLNLVVGFAGLLDLGYVAFYAFGRHGGRLVGLRPLRRRRTARRASTSASATSPRACPVST